MLGNFDSTASRFVSRLFLSFCSVCFCFKMSMQGTLSAAERSVRSVFVGNIPYEATEEQLKDIFSEVGPVVSFRLVYDRETGKPKGYGFCEYKDQDTALSAMRNLNGYELNGRALRVDNAASEKNKEELKNLQASLGGPPIESPYGTEVDPDKAPEAISKAVASLPPEQMFELMKQMKLCIQNNPNEARNMLLQNPQLAYALLQAQVVMRIVEPKVAMGMLHRPNTNVQPILPTTEGGLPPQQQAHGGGAMNHQSPQQPNSFSDGAFAGPGPTNQGQQPHQSGPRGQIPRSAVLGQRSSGGDEPPRGSGMPPIPDNRGGPPSQDYDMRDPRGGFDRDFRGGPPGPASGHGMGRDPRDQRDREIRDPRASQHDADHRPPSFDPRTRSVDPRTPRGPVDFDRPGGPGGADRSGGPGGAFDSRGPGFPERGNFDQHSPGNEQRDPRGGPAMAHLNQGGPPGRPQPPVQAVGRPGPPGAAIAGLPGAAPISNQDQEKAALIMQVLQLSDQQIALLPPEQRQSIMVLKEQIARSAQSQ